MGDFLRTEPYTLAEELDDFDDTGSVLSDDAHQALEAAAATLSGASGALEVVRNFRNKLNQRQGANSGPAVAGKSRGRGDARGGKAGGGKGVRETIAERKARSRCKDCGQNGHWAGDDACKHLTKSVQIAETGDPTNDGFIDVKIVHVVSEDYMKAGQPPCRCCLLTGHRPTNILTTGWAS